MNRCLCGIFEFCGVCKPHMTGMDKALDRDFSVSHTFKGDELISEETLDGGDSFSRSEKQALMAHEFSCQSPIKIPVPGSQEKVFFQQLSKNRISIWDHRKRYMFEGIVLGFIAGYAFGFIMLVISKNIPVGY